MGTTVNDALLFHAVSDDLAMTMRANDRQRLNGAFEGVKSVSVASHRYFESFSSPHNLFPSSPLIQLREWPGSETRSNTSPTNFSLPVRTARSPNETMPTNRFSRLSTGKRRTCFSSIFLAASFTSSSSKQ